MGGALEVKEEILRELSILWVWRANFDIEKKHEEDSLVRAPNS